MRYEKAKDSIQYLDMPLSLARIRERAGLGVRDTLVPAHHLPISTCCLVFAVPIATAADTIVPLLVVETN